MKGESSWDWLRGSGPLMIVSKANVCMKVRSSSPLWARRYAWKIRRFPRLAWKAGYGILVYPPKGRSSIRGEWRPQCL